MGCGACANSESNKCYTKFGFTDAECSCANNDGAPPAHCGTQWYMWNCVKNGHNGFIDSGCTKCEGMNHVPAMRSLFERATRSLVRNVNRDFRGKSHMKPF